jgi:DNA primase
MNLYELISQNTSLRRVAATNGGEYAGPCPFCGGKDRFHVWPDSERPGFWCRGCGKRGDAIQYLRERDGLTFHEAQAQVQLTSGALFEEALATTSVKKAKAKNVKPASPLSDDGSPSWEWQTEVKILCRLACRTLWSPEGNQALAYLHQRGLNDETIRKALLGYLSETTSETAQAWGFASDEKRVWQPAGIIILWIIGKSIWGIRIRSIEQGDMYRYIQIRGSRNALYRAGSIGPDTPAVLNDILHTGAINPLVETKSLTRVGARIVRAPTPAHASCCNTMNYTAVRTIIVLSLLAPPAPTRHSYRQRSALIYRRRPLSHVGTPGDASHATPTRRQPGEPE